MKSSKLLVGKDGLGDFHWVTRYKLDDVLGQTGLKENLVDKPVGGDGKVTRLPDDNIAHECWGARQVTGDGSKVEWAHGIDEAFKRAVFKTVPQPGRIVLGLLGEELLRVVDVEAEEVCQLGGGINLSLPRILALPEDRRGHDLIAILVGDKVGSLEEDGRTIREGEGLPGRFGGQSSLDGLINVGGCGRVVVGDLASVVRGVELMRNRRRFNLGGNRLDVSLRQLV